ncbi:hypothetical protein [Phycicoccus sonneratiae]|uniref:Uncharacterized protein n=1 Tax=Phycicoccus sonneratiae TaxID=2807628 RepID=A0ABS2CI07_9MICO|nr:hypothetical protein [Phycicoccus sonneraticus]MBM6399503.1 hypothetical protein [Phycicoccus sonneraticus]
MEGHRTAVVDWSGWVGTDRHHHVRTASDVETFLRFVGSMTARGEGYTEVSRGTDPHPMLALSVASGRAVIHLFRSPEESAVLQGDGCVPPREVAELPIVEGSSAFTGDVIVTLERAVDVLTAFARGAAPETLGAWDEL